MHCPDVPWHAFCTGSTVVCCCQEHRVWLTALPTLFTIIPQTKAQPFIPPSASIFILLLQVPFIGWTGDMPLAGNSIQKLLQSAAKPFVSAFMKRTGQQFFMHDTHNGHTPLLVSSFCLSVYLSCHVCVFPSCYIHAPGHNSRKSL